MFVCCYYCLKRGIMKLVLIILIVILVQNRIYCSLTQKYHSNQELLKYMVNFTQRFPHISSLYSIGTSVRGLNLSVLKLTTTEDQLAPNVKLVGNIHGNEAITREVLLQFIEYIGIASTEDLTIKALLHSTVIHVLPSLNPDGFNSAQIGVCSGSKGRNNANDIDLNRDYPAYNTNQALKEQPETTAIRKWLNTTGFVLSAALHSGTLVANYPFDFPQKLDMNRDSQESKTPDDDVFKHLAITYANNHPIMQQPNSCGNNLNFTNGITNGAKWYALKGGMGDYNYAFAGVAEVTLEISCCKFPITKQITKIFNQNKAALIAFIFQAQRGVKGTIIDYDVHTANLKGLSLMIEGRNTSFYPDSHGRFWRILLPGKYTLLLKYYDVIYKKIPFNVNASHVTVLEIRQSQTLTTSVAENINMVTNTAFEGIYDRVTQSEITDNKQSTEKSNVYNDDRNNEKTSTNKSSFIYKYLYDFVILFWILKLSLF